MPPPQDLSDKQLKDYECFVRDPEKRVKQLIRKISYSGETDLNKDDISELKSICKISSDSLMVVVHKECMKHLRKDHSQIRVTTLKLLDYLFQKSHVIRERLLDEFDSFIQLTLAVTQRPKVQLKLPPPKKFAALLQELGAKSIHKWHADFGEGYEKLRYAYRFLREHQFVDFSRFQVSTREQLIKQQKIAEQQEKILTRAIENKLKELQELKPDIDELLAQIDSLVELLVPIDDSVLEKSTCQQDEQNRDLAMQKHGFANLAQNIQIEFGPFMEIKRNEDNKDVVQYLRDLKKELIDGKLRRLISIEKTISKRSDQMVANLREIIDLKSRCTNTVMKLGELQIVNDDLINDPKASTLDSADSDSDGDFAEVEPKEGLESYIPKSLRFEYGLQPIDPNELSGQDRVSLDAEILPSTSEASINPARACNVRLETGKLCPRRDKFKCPFHGKIIPRDHLGVPIDDDDRIEEEKRKRSKQKQVPEWQDPQLLAEIKAATGVDLTMPKRTSSGRMKSNANTKLLNAKTCDLTPKKRLQKKLRSLMR